MSERAEVLATRRERLTAEIARGREELSAAGDLRQPLQALERIQQRAVFVRDHQAWFILPLLGLALVFPRRTLRFLAAAYATWRTLRPPPVQAEPPAP